MPLDKYEVIANLPGWDGPFVLECVSSSPDIAESRCMFSLMAAGKFNPEGSLREAKALFKATKMED